MGRAFRLTGIPMGCIVGRPKGSKYTEPLESPIGTTSHLAGSIMGITMTLLDAGWDVPWEYQIMYTRFDVNGIPWNVPYDVAQEKHTLYTHLGNKPISCPMGCLVKGYIIYKHPAMSGIPSDVPWDLLCENDTKYIHPAIKRFCTRRQKR